EDEVGAGGVGSVDRGADMRDRREVADVNVRELRDPHAIVPRIEPLDVHLVLGYPRRNRIWHSPHCRMPGPLGNARRATAAAGTVGFASHALAWQHEGAWLSRRAPAPRARAAPGPCAAALFTPSPATANTAQR